MTHRETVAFIMKIFNEEYHGKFVNSKGRLKIWAQLLNGFSEKTIMAAAYHLVSVRKDWAPDIATVREQCVLISDGELQLPTGAESWDRIKRKMGAEPDLELKPMEKEALAQTSSIYDLRRSENPSLDRAHYIKAFDKLVEKAHMDRLTLPEVKAVVSEAAGLLPAPEDTPKLEGSTGDAYSDPTDTGTAAPDWDNVTCEEIVADLQEATQSGVRYDDAGNEIWNYDKAAEHYGDKMDELKKMWGEKK